MNYDFKWAHEILFAAVIAASIYVIQGAMAADLGMTKDGRELAISLAAGGGRVFFAALFAGLAKVKL